jgi:CHAD domain-containing protein
LLPDCLPTDGLLAALTAEFGLEIAPEYEATQVYVDTFDWRLYRQGCLLHCHGVCWTLYRNGSNEVTVQEGEPELHASCSAHDFPPGKLRELLEPILGIRCLLPLATVHLQGVQIRLLNQDKKTAARIVVETLRPATADGKPGYRLLRLSGVRGYKDEQEGVRRILADIGVTEIVSPSFGFEKACQAQGRTPLDYSSKFTLELDGNETAREAMVKVYQALLDTITRNVPGVLADHDPEFLHDLRIAIRRTRTGLSLMKRVLPDSVTGRFSREFSRLGTLTGAVRDLDVYLLAYEGYHKRLPLFLRPGLQDYFVKLRHKRQAEQEKLARMLRTRKTRNTLTVWQRALKQHDRQPADLANLPVRELADRIILKRYRRVVRSGQELDASTPDAEVHRLRIQCKKLRYSIEFFASLYPKQKRRALIRQLKKLQNHLGRFNDLSVQQEMLRQSLSDLPAGQRRNLDLAASFGGLLKSLFQEQQDLRTHFAKAFVRFSDQKTTALFHELFRKR